MSPEHNSGIGSSQSERTRPVRSRGTIASRALQSRAWARRDDRSWSGVRRRHRKSNSAADPAGLELHDCRSARPTQSSAAPGGTAAGVANQESQVPESSSAPAAVRVARFGLCVSRARQPSRQVGRDS
jgi:hypothetical protein